MKYDIKKMKVNVRHLDRAIGGDAYAVIRAFCWHDTPQGYEYWRDQDCGVTPLDIDALKDIKRQYMHHTGKAGKLKDMYVKAGDVVRKSKIGGLTYTIKERFPGVLAIWSNDHNGFWGVKVDCSEQDYTLISLADDAQPDTPKKWRDMTDAEKGALLLAAHEGKVIECIGCGLGSWSSCEPMWRDERKYRVKPKPVRETVAMYGRNFDGEWSFGSREPAEDTHRITFDTINGEPITGTFYNEDGDIVRLGKI